ncbi:hypothetical protein [Alicyclobacillus dauci]|uniref:Uncharacterized protein n=1 Tax=Alicyclobacillus dauci TaxID=1475485 RepID=A0ABY6Z1Z4_9BACL|nr:hypothetical protein [Alicyclobacillus dauci]WAH36236.1 hypothetical protein NZD86_18635 [Alicyclobacillus dauci]
MKYTLFTRAGDSVLRVDVVEADRIPAKGEEMIAGNEGSPKPYRVINIFSYLDSNYSVQTVVEVEPVPQRRDLSLLEQYFKRLEP